MDGSEVSLEYEGAAVSCCHCSVSLEWLNSVR